MIPKPRSGRLVPSPAVAQRVAQRCCIILLRLLARSLAFGSWSITAPSTEPRDEHPYSTVRISTALRVLHARHYHTDLVQQRSIPSFLHSQLSRNCKSSKMTLPCKSHQPLTLLIALEDAVHQGNEPSPSPGSTKVTQEKPRV